LKSYLEVISLIVKQRLNSLKRWLVIHDLITYDKYNDKIFNKARSKSKKPISELFGQIKKDDLVVYYAVLNRVVVGLFKVISDLNYTQSDKHDYPMTFYNIRPIKTPKKGHFVDFQKLIKDPNIQFECFEKEAVLNFDDDHICLKLSEQDYDKIENAFSNMQYLKPIEEVTNPNNVGVFAALLDFHSDRATSFASLFVASIFGLVTLSAIIKNIGIASWQYGFTIIPYLGFLIAGIFTWKRFSYYADIAHQIESVCIRHYNYFKLRNTYIYEKDKSREIDFRSFLRNRYRDQQDSWLKKKLFSVWFKPLSILVIVFLTIIVYWYPIIQILKLIQDSLPNFLSTLLFAITR
jgi:hypothetical protein